MASSIVGHHGHPQGHFAISQGITGATLSTLEDHWQGLVLTMAARLV